MFPKRVAQPHFVHHAVGAVLHAIRIVTSSVFILSSSDLGTP
jgi:hypothetical protein